MRVTRVGLVYWLPTPLPPECTCEAVAADLTRTDPANAEAGRKLKAKTAICQVESAYANDFGDERI
jgi:hypothetical protein